MSKWTEHKKKWSNCERCLLVHQRSNIVLARGKLPCDVLFVGEGPGESEDVLGKPFVGPAGKLLDYMIEQAGIESHRLAFTNLIACIPRDVDTKKVEEPPVEAIKSCTFRLAEFMVIARPSLIVCVGKLATKWVPDIGYNSVSIVHPAAILRGDVSQKGLRIQKATVVIRDAVESL